jgi:hypothetical protein
MAHERWYHGDIKNMPPMNVHIDGTPDVPDIVRPGDWVTDDGIGIVMVVKIDKGTEGEWDICPGAESWWIHYLGIGYMNAKNVGFDDCGAYSHVVAVDGKLLQLYKLGWNESEVQIVPKPDYVVVSTSAEKLIQRMNPLKINMPIQLSLFALEGI